VTTAVPTSSPAALIDLHDVSRTFDTTPALAPTTLHIDAGEFLAILGPSGCGKSTLLRLIAGLDQPTTGVVTAPPLPGVVFQDAHLLPWRTVMANVMLPLEILRRADHELAMQELARVGLADFAHKYPAQLSGGMRMRVSLARAMVTRPRLLLLDEPFAALDEITRHALDEDLRRLWAETRTTVIFVTHSLVEATFLARRAIVMSKRPGRIVLDRTLELPHDRSPELRSTAEFAREMGTLFAALQEGSR
jgi:NitT/TauT family transport system ATP-binding protein